MEFNEDVTLLFYDFCGRKVEVIRAGTPPKTTGNKAIRVFE
jgi:hypothetical protein